MTFFEGDPVWYHQTLRGGYGYEGDVPGIVIGECSETRVTIEVCPNGSPPLVSKRIVVHRKNLSPRSGFRGFRLG